MHVACHVMLARISLDTWAFSVGTDRAAALRFRRWRYFFVARDFRNDFARLRGWVRLGFAFGVNFLTRRISLGKSRGYEAKTVNFLTLSRARPTIVGDDAAR
jgi:hypothetical protein